MRCFLVLVGPSAVGKTTVMQQLLAISDRFMSLRSMTTRPPRTSGDTEYFYVSDETFAAAVRDGELVEHMTYGTYAYGTPRSEVRRAEEAGRCPLLILDLVGARALKCGEDRERVYTVYLYDRLDVMEARLYARELAVNPCAEALVRFVRRKEANVRDYLGIEAYAPYIDCFIENTDTPTDTAARILRAFEAEMTMSPSDKATVVQRLRGAAEEKANYRV